jgi:hypothetical protein
MVWIPKCLTPSASGSGSLRGICAWVNPYIASSGLPMMALPFFRGPGL